MLDELNNQTNMNDKETRNSNKILNTFVVNQAKL